MIRKISTLAMIVVSVMTAFSQELINCDTNIVAGQNIIVNGGFEGGDTGFESSHDSWNSLNILPDFSTPGQYYVSGNTSRFNSAFSGSPIEGNNYLMVDGLCDPGSIVWEQKINIAQNTRYFFEVFISSIHPLSTANLSFEINGQILPERIIAPTTTGQWISFVDSSWFSNTVEGEITIRIRNDQTVNCANGNDFALDNISFTAGCGFGSDGEIPDLGEDLSLCGTDGDVILTPNVPTGNIYKYLWSTDDTTSSVSITESGTYAVCMTTNGSCVKSDIITITDDFQILLDGDKAVCKEVTDTLAIDHTGPLVSYEWYKDGVKIPGATNDTLIPTEAGTYRVDVTDGAAGCGLETDEMTLSVGSFTIDLGDNQQLCSPGLANLDAGYEGTNYQWFLDDVRLGQFSTQTIQVNQIGEYKVIVSDAICPNAESTITVTSETFTAVNANFCPVDSNTVTLSIENTTSTADNYIWYSDAALTNQVGTGFTYTTHDSLQETTSFYVKDNSVFQESAGPLVSDNASGGFGEGVTDKYIAFDVTNNIVIDSVLVFPMFNQNFNIGFVVYDRNTDILVTSSISNIDLATNPGGNNLAAPTYIPVNISLAPGQYYVKNTGTTGSLHYNQGQWTPSFPYTDPSGILSIIGLSPSEQWQAALYGYFYDWHFSSGAICDAVEVQAVFDPIICSNCEPPTELSLTQTGTLDCPGDLVTLTSDTTGGKGTWKYSWFKDGLLLPDTTTSIVIDYVDAGLYSVAIQDSIYPLLCNLSSSSLPVNPIDISVTATLNTDLEDPICLINNIDINVTNTTGFSPTPTAGDYTWSVNNVIDVSSTSSVLTGNFSDADIIEVSISGLDACGNLAIATDKISLTATPAITPNLSISAISGCAIDDITVTASLTPTTLLNGAIYTWYNGTNLESTETTGSFTSRFSDNDSITIITTFGSDVCVSQSADTASTIAIISTILTPSVTIDVDKNDVCSNDQPLSFDIITSENGGTPGYQWFVNNIAIAETNSTYNSSTLTNGDLVKLEMTSSLSCVDVQTVESNEIIISLKPVVTVSVELNESLLEVCDQETIDLTTTVTPFGTPGTFKWTKNDIAFGTNTSDQSITSFNNNDFIKVEFTPTIECPLESFSTSLPVLITIANPAIEIAEVGTDWCETKENTIRVITSENGGNVPSYQWFINGAVQLDNGTNLVRSNFTEGDSISIILTPSFPNAVCNRDTASVIVSPLITPLEVNVSLNDSSICDDDIYQIISSATNEGDNPFYQYFINDVAITDISNGFSNLENGDEIKISLSSSISCLVKRTVLDSVTITVVQTPNAVITPNELELTTFEEATLDGSMSDAVNTTYLWEAIPSITDNVTIDENKLVVTPTEFETNYILTVSRTEEETTCSSQATAIIKINTDIKIPTAFSPNGDGINDSFEIDRLENLDRFKLTIYNKWGNEIYESESASDLWDGNRNGEPMPVGTYYYIFDYTIDGEDNSVSHYVSLLR